MTVTDNDDIVEQLAGQVDELTRRVEQLSQPVHGQSPGDGTQEHELYFPDMPTWVQELWLPLFGWRVDGKACHWCVKWWDHAEAIFRLESLWRSWEAFRLDPVGMSNWTVEADRQRVELMGSDGVFRACNGAVDGRAAYHEPYDIPVSEPPPPSWWTAGE